MRILLGAWAALILLNYAFAPGHAVTRMDVIGFFFPLQGTASLTTWIEVSLSRGRAIAAWLLVNAALFGTGLVAARWIGLRGSVLRAWLLGVAPTALTILGLGLCGLMLKTVLAIFLGGAGLAAIALLRPSGRTISNLRSRLSGCRPLLLALGPCLLALPAVLAPESAFDALRYHLALPDLYLREHKIFYVERFLFASFPQTTEMLYATSLAFGTTVAAKLLNWQFFVLSTIQIFILLRPRLSATHTILLCAGFAAMPFLSSHSAFAGVDHPIMCLELAAFGTILGGLSGRAGSRTWLIVGWLLGTALGMKYLGAFAIGAAAMAIVFAAGSARKLLKPFLLISVPVAGVIALVWGLKNWILTGNPIYPYVFGHMQIEPETFRLHLLWAEEWKQGYTWLGGWLKMIPISLTSGVYDSHGEALAPYVFAIVGLAAASPKPFTIRERWLLALTATTFVVWSHSGGGIYRYLAPFYPASVLLAGYLLSGFTRVPARAVTIFLALALVSQLPVLMAAHRRQSDAAGLLFGFQTEREYLNRAVSPPYRYLPAIEEACATAGPDRGRLYMLGDPKAFYAPGRCRTEFEFAPPLLHVLARESATPARMRVRFKQRGITAILYRADGMVSIGKMSGSLLKAGALKRLQDFWSAYAEPAWAADYPAENCFYQCYRLRDAPGAFVPPSSQLWYLLPSMEVLTQRIDKEIDAGMLREARGHTLALIAREPKFAPGWFRLHVIAKKLGRTAEKSRAAVRLKELGYAKLI